MSLQAGHQLAHYEILEPIGKGGMGEVYRAKDGKLGRDVAIKVLPDEFAQDEERLRRFQREAKVLASLNHPNIASIYGLEQSGETHYLVLELVPGETLAERIASGPIPVEEALDIATKIAEALEEAHEQGVVHRDLKPANVKITPDGKVKVLDFGLAKAFAEEAAEGDTATSMSPTITRNATRIGVILGTAAYMSPEQARGKRVDRRADIWAFGVVLYEMLTGRRAFEAEDVSLTLAAVMTSEPRWDALPSDVSPTLRMFLTHCLRKDPKERVRDIGDVRLALGGAFELPAIGSERASSKSIIVASLLTASLTALVAGLAVWGLVRTSAPVAHLAVSTPPSSTPRLSTNGRDIAVSPDGQWIAYPGLDGDLHVRHLDRLETNRFDAGLPQSPFVSPDGTWVGFGTDGATLWKIPVLGGPRVAICETQNGFFGGSWAADDTIIFGTETGLFRVSADGGEPQQLTAPDGASETGHRWPEILPGQDAVLFSLERDGGTSTANFDIAVLSLDTGKYHVVIRGGTSPRYVGTGHIVYAVDGALMAVPFDVDRLETTGDGVRAIPGLSPKFNGAANFDVARNGTLVYMGSGRGSNRTLVWVDRDGAETPVDIEPRGYNSLALSPEGDRVVTYAFSGSGTDVWVHHLTRRTTTRLTFDPAADIFPVWTRDGEHVVFSSARDGGGIYRKPADGTGSAERLVDARQATPFSISPDGRRLVGTMRQAGSGNDLIEASLDGGATLKPIVVAAASQWNPQISPSGKWLAYMSRESGPPQIYVRPYPNVDANRWQVSTGGGNHPIWSPREDELFYRNENQMLAVPVSTDDGFEFGAPSVLFEGEYVASATRTYDVAHDAQRFLMIKEEASQEEIASNEIQIVLNWHEELKRLVPKEN